MSRIIGRALGSVVSPMVEYVDVDGVIQRIDVDEVMQRIDVDSLLDHVDINRHLDRVDINRHLERVDLDALLQRVDIQELVNRSDLATIISQSSTGVFTKVADSFRIQLALLDQAVESIMKCRCRQNLYRELPAAPGIQEEKRPYPRGTARRAVALQGRYAGAVSGFTGWFIDVVFTSVIFSLGIIVFEIIWKAIIKDDFEIDTNTTAYSIVYFCWGFFYQAGSLALTGRTLGRAIVGVVVVSKGGTALHALQACINALLMPVTIVTVLGWVITFYRRDRRMLNHLVSCTCVLYSWDAKAARIRDKDMPEIERVQPVFLSAIKTEKPGHVEP